MFRRRRNVIMPGLQLKVSAIFVAAMALGLVVFAVQMFHSVTGMIDSSLVDETAFHQGLLAVTVSRLLVTLGLCAALTIAVAIVVTFRIAGPMYRMERFLQDLKDGKNPGPCTLRKGDAFHDFCVLLNEATEPLRRTDEAPDAADEARTDGTTVSV